MPIVGTQRVQSCPQRCCWKCSGILSSYNIVISDKIPPLYNNYLFLVCYAVCISLCRAEHSTDTPSLLFLSCLFINSFYPVYLSLIINSFSPVYSSLPINPSYLTHPNLIFLSLQSSEQLTSIFFLTINSFTYLLFSLCVSPRTEIGVFVFPFQTTFMSQPSCYHMATSGLEPVLVRSWCTTSLIWKVFL